MVKLYIKYVKRIDKNNWYFRIVILLLLEFRIVIEAKNKTFNKELQVLGFLENSPDFSSSGKQILDFSSTEIHWETHSSMYVC